LDPYSSSDYFAGSFGVEFSSRSAGTASSRSAGSGGVAEGGVVGEDCDVASDVAGVEVAAEPGCGAPTGPGLPRAICTCPLSLRAGVRLLAAAVEVELPAKGVACPDATNFWAGTLLGEAVHVGGFSGVQAYPVGTTEHW